jgi:hypothetical protein
MACAVRLVGVVVAHLVAVTACYQPELRDCTVQCSAPTDCAGDQVCRADGWCAMPTVKDCPMGGGNGNGDADGDNSNVTPDAATAPHDAPNLCQLGCANGTCIDGVCVIDCSATSACQNDDVTCPPGLPCRVICGHSACTKKVRCGQASSCEVRCNGDNSCSDEVVCGVNRCAVHCVGVGACKKTTCKQACACDVSCIGPSSCVDLSECSAPTCRLGEGCSSLLTGCNTC